MMTAIVKNSIAMYPFLGGISNEVNLGSKWNCTTRKVPGLLILKKITLLNIKKMILLNFYVNFDQIGCLDDESTSFSE